MLYAPHPKKNMLPTSIYPVKDHLEVSYNATTTEVQ